MSINFDKVVSKKEEKQEEEKLVNDDEDLVWHVWQCENPECKKPNVAGCSRCSKCKIKAYCGHHCQKSDWKFHKQVCTRLPIKLVSWVEKIRTYISIMRNDPDGTFEIWQDVYDEYKGNPTVPSNPPSGNLTVPFNPPLTNTSETLTSTSSATSPDGRGVWGQHAPKRGVVVVDLAEQSIEPNLVLPDGSKPGKTVIKDKRSFIWKYVADNNESFLVADEYARLRYLMANYNPENEFVLMVLCSDEDIENGQTCHIEEIIKVSPPPQF